MEVNSVSRHGRFTPKERAPGTHWIGGWVGPRAGLDKVEISKKKKFMGIIQYRFLHKQSPRKMVK
jgi:hypothetical protein